MRTSVIVTTYNKPDALAKVLQGLRCQTRPPEEVIVADDGSGSETAEMIHGFMSDFSCPLFHVWQEDCGFRLAKIRNKAINNSTGDYIILLDGDCIPGKHFIEDHLALAKKGFFFQGKRVLVGKILSSTFTQKHINSVGKRLKFVFSREISNRHHLIRLPLFPAIFSTGLSGIRGCNMGFFREDIFAVNGYNEDFVGWGREDSELVVRFFNYGLKKREHPFMAICYHLWHEENDKTRLSINDKLLQRWIESGEYSCPNGLIKR